MRQDLRNHHNGAGGNAMEDTIAKQCCTVHDEYYALRDERLIGFVDVTDAPDDLLGQGVFPNTS